MLTQIALRSIVNKSKESMLYILAMSSLVMVIVTPLAIANSYSTQLSMIIPQLRGDYILLMNSTASTTSESIIDYSWVEKIKTNGTAIISSQLVKYFMIKVDGREVLARFRGIEPNQYYGLKRIKIVEGDGPSSGLNVNVGWIMATRLNISVGDRISVYIGLEKVRLRVTGVIECSGPCDEEILIHLRDLWQLDPSARDKISIIELKVAEGFEKDKVLEDLLDKASGLRVIDEQVFQRAALELLSSAKSSIRSWSLALYPLIAVAAYLISTKISMESSRELLFIRSIGASRRKLFYTIFIRSLLVSVLGVLLGISIGITLSQVFFRIASIILSLGYVQPPSLTPWDFLEILSLSTVSVSLGVARPAATAAKKGVGGVRIW